MRLKMIAIAAAAMLISGPASAAAWVEHRFEDLGVLKEFPGEPTRSAGEYVTPVVGTAPATDFYYEEDNIVFEMRVVELQDKVGISASILGECVANVEAEGTTIANMTNRVQNGEDAIYGRLVSVSLANDGGRRQTACLYNATGRLYIIRATVLPEHGQPNSSMVIRFTNSLSFNLEGYTD
jgi:hypothetical protein